MISYCQCSDFILSVHWLHNVCAVTAYCQCNDCIIVSVVISYCQCSDCILSVQRLHIVSIIAYFHCSHCVLSSYHDTKPAKPFIKHLLQLYIILRHGHCTYAYAVICQCISIAVNVSKCWEVYKFLVLRNCKMGKNWMFYLLYCAKIPLSKLGTHTQKKMFIHYIANTKQNIKVV